MLKVGVVGCGNMGAWHLKKYSELPNVKIVAVCEINEVLLKKAVQEYGAPRLFTDYREMAKMEDLDAVSIVLPNFLHLPGALEFLNAGKDVLCEKPMARTYAEAEKMLKKAKEKKRVLMVNMNHRWRPENSMLKELAAGGRFGEIYYLHARWLRNHTFSEKQKKNLWFANKEKSGGGTLIDIGIHMLDLSLWIMDDFQPVSVSASVYNKFYSSVDDLASALIRFQNGKTLHLETSWEAHLKDDWSISLLGTRAGCHTSPFTVFAKENGIPSETSYQLPAEFPAEKSSIGNFITAVKTRKTLEPSGEKGALLVRILEAIYLSAQKGKEVILK
ncbi:MAG: Gfo/Idh/MocA family oxidoreductase [Candidatus Omnitrophota bacterium]